MSQGLWQGQDLSKTVRKPLRGMNKSVGSCPLHGHCRANAAPCCSVRKRTQIHTIKCLFFLFKTFIASLGLYSRKRRNWSSNIKITIKKQI